MRVVGLARLVDEDLADWVQRATSPFRTAWSTASRRRPPTASARILPSEFGVEDNWPVFCEPFRQWVLEDNFTDGRPALEKVGVQFVDDVSPFELMKIRILNGGHATIAYPAGLMDIHFVHEAMQEPLVRGFLDKARAARRSSRPCRRCRASCWRTIIELIERRFSNPKIGDTIRRLCLDGSNRQPKFIIPTIADRLKAGKGIDGLALESALWCRYCFGTTDSGAVIEPNDPNWERLQATAKAAKADPAAWLAMGDIYGEVGKIAGLRRGLCAAPQGAVGGRHARDADALSRRHALSAGSMRRAPADERSAVHARTRHLRLRRRAGRQRADLGRACCSSCIAEPGGEISEDDAYQRFPRPQHGDHQRHAARASSA